MALRAYIDASHKDTGVFTVAGYAFGFDGASKASKKWQSRLDGRTFHMTDLSARRGEFDKFTREESGQLLKDLVSILSKHSVCCAAVSININEFGSRLPTSSTNDHGSKQILKGFRTPYAFCFHMLMTHFRGLVLRKGGNQREINYIVETGDNGEGDVREYLGFVEKHENQAVRDMYCMNSINFAGKNSKALLLQSADFLAWEWSKYVDRRADGKEMRPSLKAGIGGRPDITETEVGYTASSEQDGYAICSHYTGEITGSYLDKFRNMILSDSIDEVRGIVSSLR